MSNPYFLIVEEIERPVFLTEATDDGKLSHFIEGIFLQADVKNRNGRIYESNVLDRVVNAYLKEKVENNRAIGELGHPQGPTINPDRISHKITKLVKEGSNWHGKAKILDTPMGRIASSLMKEGVQLGVSSRGMGTLSERNGASYVNEDYMLITAADIVTDPSAPEAYVQGIMEGRTWIMDSGRLVESEVDAVRRRIDESVRQRNLNLQRRIEFARFLSFD